MGRREQIYGIGGRQKDDNTRQEAQFGTEGGRASELTSKKLPPACRKGVGSLVYIRVREEDRRIQTGNISNIIKGRFAIFYHPPTHTSKYYQTHGTNAVISQVLVRWAVSQNRRSVSQSRIQEVRKSVKKLIVSQSGSQSVGRPVLVHCR